MTVVHVDVESVSTADLTRVGAFQYAAHPSTQMIICCYAFDDGPAHTWLPETESFPNDLQQHMETGKVCLAWNAQFEKAIFDQFISMDINWQCTMALAAYYGYPLSLDKAAEAMKLPFGKDKVGHALMKRMCRPRYVPNTGAPVWWHNTHQEKFERLQAYCRTDVLLERLIHTKLETNRLPLQEQQVWDVDQAMNEHGVCLDRDLVAALTAIVAQEQTRLDMAMGYTTGGAVTRCSQVAKIKAWLERKYVKTESLDKEALVGLIQEHQGKPHILYVLELRQEAAKSSTAKLKAMTNWASDTDDRMRGLIQYYGANRTGRFAGRGPQPHNYPRPDIKDPENAIAYIKAGMTVEGVKAFWGSPMSVVSSCLRGCFVPKKDHIFLSVDFSQIEARVLAWLVGQTDILDLFVKGEDVYTYAANQVGSKDRQLGKVLTLACGFGMGPDKFRETAAKYGVELSSGQSHRAVDAWRTANTHVTQGWHRLESVCKHVSAYAQNSRDVFSGKLLVARATGPLIIQLPSGRELFYREPAIVKGRFNTPQLSYMGLNGYTRKWERIETYGGKLIENVVQAIARDILTWAMVELRNKGLNVCLTVHDELLLEVYVAKYTLKDLIRHVEDVVTHGPDWAQGLPLAAESWTGDRYRK